MLNFEDQNSFQQAVKLDEFQTSYDLVVSLPENMIRSKRKALLLEDDSFDAAVTRELLEKRIDPSFEVTHVSSLMETIDMVKRTNFDVALVDLSLSDSAGLTTLRETIRANRNIPVVVLTGDNSKETAIRAIGIGAQEYLPKDQLNDKTLDRIIAFAMHRKTAETDTLRHGKLDNLTGLPSQDMVMSELKFMTKRAKATKQKIGAMLIDIQAFSEINHLYGHATGDALLMHVADEIQNAIQKPCIATRFEGDEFCVLIEGLRGEQDLCLLKNKVAQTLCKTFIYEGHEINYVANIVSHLNIAEDKHDLITLLECLKIQMIRLKYQSAKEAV